MGAPALPLRKLQVPAQRLVPLRETRPTISPDGEKIVFAAGDTLWIQELNQLDPRQIATSWRPAHLFWSPDSRFVGFVSENKLWKVSIAGGAPIALAIVDHRRWRARHVALGWQHRVFTEHQRQPAFSKLRRTVVNCGLSFRCRQVMSTFTSRRCCLAAMEFCSSFTARRAPTPSPCSTGHARKSSACLESKYSFRRSWATGHIVFNRLGKSNGVWALPLICQARKNRRAISDRPRRLLPQPLSGRDADVLPAHVERASPTRDPRSRRRGRACDRRAAVAAQRTRARARRPPRGGVAGANARDDLWIYDVERGSRTRLTFLESPAVFPAAWTTRNRVVYQYTVPARLRFATCVAAGRRHGRRRDARRRLLASLSNSATLSSSPT